MDRRERAVIHLKQDYRRNKIIQESPGSACASGLGVCTEPAHADTGVCVLSAHVAVAVIVSY
jgi:hypothetical protein